MEMTDKTFFISGDIVTLNKDIDNLPKIVVVDKVTRSLMNKDGNKETIFVGIKTRWFDKNQTLQEAIFSTKDLKHI
jgi:hypothetical protein